jgi:hypothetical protein
MDKVLSQNEQSRLASVRTRLEKSRVLDLSFSGEVGKDLDYMENVLDILEKNQDWIDENAKKKAAKYE